MAAQALSAPNEERRAAEPALGRSSRAALVSALSTRPDFSAFSPALLLGLRLAPGGAERFHEDILASEVPVLFRGGLLSADSASLVDLRISDPAGATIFKSPCGPSCFFRVMARKPGTYNLSIVLKVSGAQGALVNFAFGKGNSSVAQAQHFRAFSDQAAAAEAALLGIQTETTSLGLVRVAHLRALGDLWARISILCLLHVALLLGMQCYTASYVAGLLSNREGSEQAAGASPSRQDTSPGRRAVTGLRSRRGATSSFRLG